MAEQLAFDLPQQVRQGADSFFVTDANRTAYAMVRTPEAWPDDKLALVGPPGSGKTHLARIFASRHSAHIISAPEITPALPMPVSPLVVEDAELLPRVCQEWLFHAHNHLAAQQCPLLITSTKPPATWGLSLPDLDSRLSAATVVHITEPDDPLLSAVLLKHFQDRQLIPSPDVVAYLHTRLPRSFTAIRDTVRLIDEEALAQGKNITRPFVAAVLDAAQAQDQEAALDSRPKDRP